MRVGSGPVSPHPSLRSWLVFRGHLTFGFFVSTLTQAHGDGWVVGEWVASRPQARGNMPMRKSLAPNGTSSTSSSAPHDPAARPARNRQSRRQPNLVNRCRRLTSRAGTASRTECQGTISDGARHAVGSAGACNLIAPDLRDLIPAHREIGGVGPRLPPTGEGGRVGHSAALGGPYPSARPAHAIPTLCTGLPSRLPRSLSLS